MLHVVMQLLIVTKLARDAYRGIAVKNSRHSFLIGQLGNEPILLVFLSDTYCLSLMVLTLSLFAGLNFLRCP